MKGVCVLVLVILGAVLCIQHDFKGFDDTILYTVNWPGTFDLLDEKQQSNEILPVISSDKEKFDCVLPKQETKEATSMENYDGPSPINLLKPLFNQKICSYRLESYWSYEVCHGRYIRQYHEEREGKQIKTQEFFLGHWDAEKQAKLEADMNAAAIANEKPRTTKVEGLTLPCVEMLMEGGSECDLSGKPRRTRLLYVCYLHGKHEVYTFKEISTCEYEVIILSPFLCEHPLYSPRQMTTNNIDCFSVGDAPKKPRNLLIHEVETLRFQHQSIRLLNDEPRDVLAVLKVETVDKDGETHLKFELHPLNEEGEVTPPKPVIEAEKLPNIVDDSPVRAFLNGENCLNGGTGWWKYEFCYGKHVTQYHVDRDGSKVILRLGDFHQDAHLEWIKENPGKRPRPVDQRTSVSHFYSGGDVCDKTNKPRQTEVKLKCLENSSSPAQVSLYLLEPRTCHYILGVESPLICAILPLADENGLIKIKEVLKPESTVKETTEGDDSTDTSRGDPNKFGFD